MTPDDIEKLLQQYGKNQRQQMQVSAIVRRMAHRQSRRLTMAACMAVLVLIVGTVLFRHQPKPQPQVLTADLHKEIPVSKPNARSIPDTKAHLISTHAQQPHQQKFEANIEAALIPITENDITERISPHTTHNDTLSPNQNVIPTKPLPPIVEMPLQNIPPTIEPTSLHAIQSTSPSANDSPRFTMAIGASVMGNTNLDYTSPTNSRHTIDPSDTYSDLHVNHSNAIIAHIGVDYTIASTAQGHLNIGLNLSGYAQQSNVDKLNISHQYKKENEIWLSSYTNNDAIIGVTIQNFSGYAISLYASLPFTYDLYPNGHGKTGWKLSLTPARNLVTATTLANLPMPNPWKITLGLGVVFPRGIARHISLTANLLPLYTDHPLHEIGIVIGF